MNLKTAETLAKAVIKNRIAPLEDTLRAHKDRFVLVSGRKDSGWMVALSIFPKMNVMSMTPYDDEGRAKEWITVYVGSNGETTLNEVAILSDLLKA